MENNEGCKVIAVVSEGWDGAFIITGKLRMGTLSVADKKVGNGKFEYAVIFEVPETNAAITVDSKAAGAELIKWVIESLVDSDNIRVLGDVSNGEAETAT